MISLVLPYPVSANRYWRHGLLQSKHGKPHPVTFLTPEAKEYRYAVSLIARRAGLVQPYDCRVSLDIRLYPHRPQDWQARQRKLGALWDDTVQCIDLGNCEKVLADALQGVIYTDDRWIWDEHKRRMEPDGGEARVEITVQPFHVEQPQQASLLTPEPAVLSLRQLAAVPF